MLQVYILNISAVLEERCNCFHVASVSCFKRIFLGGSTGVTRRASAVGPRGFPLARAKRSKRRRSLRARGKRRGAGDPRVRRAGLVLWTALAVTMQAIRPVCKPA
jgi:hypothetical protein